MIINRIGRKCYTYIGPRLKVEILIFMDDINHPTSNVKNITRTAENLEMYENTKGYTFSVDKTKTAILISGRKKKKQYELNAHVKRGQIGLTDEYKYLGKWYNEEGDNKLSIDGNRIFHPESKTVRK